MAQCDELSVKGFFILCSFVNIVIEMDIVAPGFGDGIPFI